MNDLKEIAILLRKAAGEMTFKEALALSGKIILGLLIAFGWVVLYCLGHYQYINR